MYNSYSHKNTFAKLKMLLNVSFSHLHDNKNNELIHTYKILFIQEI